MPQSDDSTPPDLPPAQTPLTARQRLQYRFMHDQMLQFEWDLRHAVWDGRIVPEDWHGLLAEEPAGDKTRVTIRLDSDLVKFFRAYGSGWQSLLNSAVRAFVKARLAGLVDGPENMASLLNGISDRPEIGTFEKIVSGDWPDET